MQAAGCLAFTDDLSDIGEDNTWRRVKAWLVHDPTGHNVSARRLDGLSWKCCHGAKSRCLSGTGSKSWPVGITLAQPGQRLDVVLSGRMKLVFFGRFESHLYVGGFSSETSSKKVLLPAVDFLPS